MNEQRWKKGKEIKIERKACKEVNNRKLERKK
jgi:hypothetical protein